MKDYKEGLDIVYMETMLYSNDGERGSKAIENQEAREQIRVVKNTMLPIKTNFHDVPTKYRMIGISNDMDYDIKREITDKNNMIYTKEQYARMGIGIVEQYDDLFYVVELPSGWKIKPTDHSMWNDVYDNKDRKRINFFYKGAFYDRDAFVNFNTRYTVGVVPFDGYNSNLTYDERKMNPWYGVVYDCGKEIFRTTGEVSPDGSVEVWDIQENQKRLVLDYINKNYPNWEDINCYWT